MTIFDINNTSTTLLRYSLTYVEFVATLAGLLSVWFVAKQAILTWTGWLINVIRFIAIKKKPLSFCCLLFAIFYLPACDNKPKQENTRKTVDYIKKIPGIDDSIPAKVAEKGQVLIAYSDCYICHKEDERSVGPAFKDVAKRYPVNKVYIEMLAQKVIIGGSGGWGSAVMDPHPKLSLDDAKKMVTYVLSLKK